MRRTRLTKLTLASAVVAILLLSADRTLAGGFGLSFGRSFGSYRTSRSGHGYTPSYSGHGYTRSTGHGYTRSHGGHGSSGRSYTPSRQSSGCGSGCGCGSSSRTGHGSGQHGRSSAGRHPSYGHPPVVIRKPVYRPTYRIPIILFVWSW